MGLFSKLFGGRDSAPASPLRSYIDGSLPKNYTRSRKYAVDILESERRAAATVTLDMLADGSDFGGFDEGDYLNLAEIEASYLLTDCIAEPPVPTDFTLKLVFGGGRIATVTKKAGEACGTLACGGQSK
ncbi:MAG: hypothetical protein K2L38_04825, partial [Dysosmobacter sp.]|nr:hypothetical protein [Dysosmobacter sp.]